MPLLYVLTEMQAGSLRYKMQAGSLRYKMPDLTPSTLYRYLQSRAFGADRAKLIRDIAAEFDVSDAAVRGAIHDLRLDGKLIGTSQSGAFIPRTRDEAVEGVTHLLVRLRALAAVYEAQLSEINRQWPAGQMSLFDAPVVDVDVDVAVDVAV